MACARVEFLLTDRPVTTHIEFEDGSVLEDILPLIEKKLPCSFTRIGKRGCKTTGMEGDLLSSVIVTHNGSIGDPKTPLKDGDQIKVFHLVDGG